MRTTRQSDPPARERGRRGAGVRAHAGARACQAFCGLVRTVDLLPAGTAGTSSIQDSSSAIVMQAVMQKKHRFFGLAVRRIPI